MLLFCSYLYDVELSEQWELNADELTIGGELGSGQFGLVLEGIWQRGRQDKAAVKVAVKTVREGAMSDEEFKDEAKVMM